MSAEFGESQDQLPDLFPSPDKLRQIFAQHPHREAFEKYLGDQLERLFHWPETRGGLLPDIGIIRHMLAGNIVCEPFDIRLLQSNGIDVTVGPRYVKFRPETQPRYIHSGEDFIVEKDPRMISYNPYDPEEIKKFWPMITRTMGSAISNSSDWPIFFEDGTTLFRKRSRSTRSSEEYVGPYHPQRAFPEMLPLMDDPQIVENAQILGMTVEELKAADCFSKLRHDDLYVLINPGQMILGHTEQIIGGQHIVSTTISGNSTAGRHGFEVCSDANLGGVGFVGQWALEITNKRSDINVAMPLVAGTVIATVQFWEVTEPPVRSYQGAYKDQNVDKDKEALRPKALRILRNVEKKSLLERPKPKFSP